MNTRDRIFLIVLGAAIVICLWTIVRQPEPTEHREDISTIDSLKVQAAIDHAVSVERMRLADSVAAFIAEQEMKTQPAKIIYVKVHEEAPTLPVAAKWSYMGRWPVDTVAP